MPTTAPASGRGRVSWSSVSTRALGQPGTPSMIESPRLTRKIVSLFTVLRSISPSNGMAMRGRVLKPSSSLSSVTSMCAEGSVVESGIGRFTCSQVF